MPRRILKVYKSNGYYERDKNDDLERVDLEQDVREISRSSVIELLSAMMEFAKQHPNAKIDEAATDLFLVDYDEDGKTFDEIGIRQIIEED